MQNDQKGRLKQFWAIKMLVLRLAATICCALHLISASRLSGQAVEKFIPIQNPLQNNSFFRIATYNGQFFDLNVDQSDMFQKFGVDLGSMRVFVLIMQEFPKVYYKSPGYAVVKQYLAAFGLVYLCENFRDGDLYDYGNIYASRYPLTGCKSIELYNDELAGQATVQYQGRDINLVGAHLERSAEGGAERMNQMTLLVDYIIASGLDQGNTFIAIDTTEQYNSDPIWTLRTGLPIEDSFSMLTWTRPTYTSYQGITRNYIFALKSMKGLLVGSYVLQSGSNSFAAIIDLWKYPDQIAASYLNPVPAKRPEGNILREGTKGTVLQSPTENRLRV